MGLYTWTISIGSYWPRVVKAIERFTIPMAVGGGCQDIFEFGFCCWDAVGKILGLAQRFYLILNKIVSDSKYNLYFDTDSLK